MPANFCYGIHTLRALENFPITGTTIQSYPRLIQGLASVKEAYAAGKSVAEIMLAKDLLANTQLDEILLPENLTQPKFVL